MLFKIFVFLVAGLMALVALRHRIAPFLPASSRAALDRKLTGATNTLILAGAAAVLLIVGFLLFLHWLDRP